MDIHDLSGSENLSQRQKEIILESIKLISEKGIQHLTIKNISASISVTERAIYRHFPSKHEIIKTIVDVFHKNMSGLFQLLAKEELSPLALIDKFMQIHFENFAKRPYMTSLLFSEEMFRNEEGLPDYMKNILTMARKNIAGFISMGQKKNEIHQKATAEELAGVVLGTIRLHILQWHLGAHKSDLCKQGREIRKTIRRILAV